MSISFPFSQSRILRGQFLWVLLLVGFGVLSVQPAIAQEGGNGRLVDLSANTVTSDASTGERINKLSGNVFLKQDDTRIWASRAIEYTARGEIIFTPFRMVESGDTLRANSARYYKKTKTGRARGNVRLSDGEVLVRAPAGFHDIDKKYSRFESGVTLVDSLSTLQSDRGEYWSTEKRALFVGSVLLSERGSVTRSDTINFLRDESIADAQGNVSVHRSGASEDDSSEVWLFGNRAHNESRNKFSTVAGDAFLVQIQPDSSAADTTLLTAERLTSREAGNVETMTGAGSVSIWRDQLAAVADSVSFRKVKTGGVSRETVRLFRSPVLWFENTQVSGDTIRITILNGELDSLFVDGNAFLAQEDTVLKRIQQVAGPQIRGRLSGSAREIRVGKSADAIYYLEEDGRLSGAYQSHSDFVVMRFSDDSLKTISALTNLEATYYAEDIIPASLELAGFDWKPDARPVRAIFANDPRFQANFVRRVVEENN